LRPDEFWNLTPVELFDLAEGYQDRFDTHMYTVAWHAALVRNVHLKRKHQKTPDQLLGKKKTMTQQDIADEVDKFKYILQERREKHGG
jgi:hypothetical protein